MVLISDFKEAVTDLMLIAWQDVLDVFPRDSHDWLHGFFNQAISGERNPEQKILLLAGKNSERKQLFIDTIIKAMGENVSFPDEKYFKIGRDHRGLDDFNNRATFTNISEGSVLSAWKANILTVEEHLSSRRKQTGNGRLREYEFDNVATKIIVADHLPRVKGWDYSSEKRFKVVEARPDGDNAFDWGDNAIADYAKDNLAEVAFMWAVTGYEKQEIPDRYGDSLPPSMRKAELRWHKV